MIDIGVNLINKQFVQDTDTVLATAKEQGVEKIILTGTSLKNSLLSEKLAAQHPDFLYSTAGIHPHATKEFSEQTSASLTALLKKPHVVAVGECGLDFDRNFSTREQQFHAFEQQLQLAKLVDKPLFLHERAAHKEFVQVMKQHQDVISKSVVHCFTSNRYHLKTYLDMGFYIGITGWICDPRRGKELQDAVKYIPLDRLMIETDSPFLIPKTLKLDEPTRRNEPQFLPHIAKEIARYMKVDVDEFNEQVKQTTKQFFSI